MKLQRQTLILSTAILALALAALAPRTAHAQGKGKIYVSDVEYGSYGSEKELAGALKRQSKTTIKGDGGNWQLNLMVFLNAAPGANAVNIVYYDSARRTNRSTSPRSRSNRTRRSSCSTVRRCRRRRASSKATNTTSARPGSSVAKKRSTPERRSR